MGLFSGKLFDFNHDGSTDFFEEALGLGAIGALLLAAEELDEAEACDEREDIISSMEEELEDLEDDRPDPDSPEYGPWDTARRALQEKLERLTEEETV